MEVAAEAPRAEAAVRRLRFGEWALPLGLAALLAALTLIPYLYAWNAQPAGRQFMGFFFLGDDANTYLAKMREGWEGTWRWTNRYSTEPGTGAWFFVFWIFLGHLAAWTHTSLLFVFHAARVAGAFALLAAGWLFIKEFVEGAAARRFALVLMAVGLGTGYVIQALGHPVVLGQQTDTLDWRMPELSAFYSILALPHFAWAAAFQAAAIVWTLRAAERSSLGYGALAGLAWSGEASIHAQMPLLFIGAFGIALLVRRPSLLGWVGVAVAVAIPLPYVAYSYWASNHVPEVLRWSAQWRNNLPPDGLSLFLALAPQLVLAALAVPAALRRRSRGDLLLLAWLALLVFILWFPNPAGNLRRRFFDGVYLPLVVLAARGMYYVVRPRLSQARRGLVSFGYVAFTAIGSAFLLCAPILFATAPTYSLSTDEVGALAWLAAHSQGAVLSDPGFGLYIPAYSSDSVYVGQYSETYNYFAKGDLATSLLAGHGDAGAFARATGLTYVVWTSSVEHRCARSAPAACQGLPQGAGAPVYDTPNAKIYVVGPLRT